MTEKPVPEGADLAGWWLQAVGEDVAEHARPLRLEPDGQLHVQCRSRAWSTQLHVLSGQVTARLNAVLPGPRVTGLTVAVR